MQKEKDTAMVLQELKNAATLSESLKVIEDNNDNFIDMTFSEFFNRFLASHQNVKLSDIVNGSGLSRQYAYAVTSGEKNGSRDKIIALCFAAGMNLAETNHALIYAKHNELYARDRRDAIIIVAINTKSNGSSETRTVIDLNILLEDQGFKPLIEV